MGKQFNVISLSACAICAGEIPRGSRRYCSKRCREKANNTKNAWRGLAWQREKREREADHPGADKIQCLICKRWYKQVGSHIFLTHKIRAREYREEYGFDLKRGQLAEEYRNLKAQQCKENGTINNLKAGKVYRFKPGDRTIGRYKRSEQTLKRLKVLTTYTKTYKNAHNK